MGFTCIYVGRNLLDSIKLKHIKQYMYTLLEMPMIFELSNKLNTKPHCADAWHFFKFFYLYLIEKK